VKVLLKNVARHTIIFWNWVVCIIFCFVKCLHNKGTLFMCVTLMIMVLHSSNFSLFGDSEIKIK
jgi:hypothetical protein